jgi:outer membrane biosynthesis protein TonB
MKFGEKGEFKPLSLPDQLIEQVEKKESEPQPERGPGREQADTKQAAQAESAPPQAPAPAAPAAPAKDAYHMRIERVLEDNLVDVYLSMPPEVRARFRTEGEALALRLRVMVEQAKVKAKEVLRLILRWLKIIPGINHYFLEQEAKIKTDKIVLLAEDRRKEKEGEIA